MSDSEKYQVKKQIPCPHCNSSFAGELYHHYPGGCGCVNTEKPAVRHWHGYCKKCHKEWIIGV